MTLNEVLSHEYVVILEGEVTPEKGMRCLFELDLCRSKKLDPVRFVLKDVHGGSEEILELLYLHLKKQPSLSLEVYIDGDCEADLSRLISLAGKTVLLEKEERIVQEAFPVPRLDLCYPGEKNISCYFVFEEDKQKAGKLFAASGLLYDDPGISGLR